MKATSGFQNFNPNISWGHVLCEWTYTVCLISLNVVLVEHMEDVSGLMLNFDDPNTKPSKSEVFPKSPCPCNSCPSANCARSLMYIMEVFLCHFCALTFLLWRLLICYLCHYSVSSSNPWSWFVIWLETHRFAKIALLFILLTVSFFHGATSCIDVDALNKLDRINLTKWIYVCAFCFILLLLGFVRLAHFVHGFTVWFT